MTQTFLGIIFDGIVDVAAKKNALLVATKQSARRVIIVVQWMAITVRV